MQNHLSSRLPIGSVSGGVDLVANAANPGLAVRWGSARLFNEGFVGVPVSLVTRYAKLGLSTGEFVFVLELMVFKWNERAPFPNYDTLAHRMGITSEMARRHAKSLESKGMLKRIQRKGQSNVFDILPLTQMLNAFLTLEEHQGGTHAQMATSKPARQEAQNGRRPLSGHELPPGVFSCRAGG